MPRLALYYRKLSTLCSLGRTPNPHLTSTHRTLHRQKRHLQHLIPFRGAATEPQTTDTTTDDDTFPHVPVMLQEVLAAFEGRQVGVHVDGTLGAGGHASAMVAAHPELHTLVGFDLDPTAHGIASARLENQGVKVIPATYISGKVELGGDDVSTSAIEGANKGDLEQQQQQSAFLVRSNFSAMGTVLQNLPGDIYGSVDAILLDFGMSSMQIDEAERGFSFLRNGPLDMRMDPNAATSAETIVNTYSEMELGRIFKELGEERYWKYVFWA